MKTHELARALSQLAGLLRSGPNVDLGDAKILALGPQQLTHPTDVAASLSALVELSRIDKRNWAALIREYDFPIEIRARDASRDILGKLASYLEANGEARERLKAGVAKRKGQASPELMKALSSLLGE